MKKLILIAGCGGFLAGSAFAGAVDDFLNNGTPPTADFIKLVKEQGFDYMGDIPGIPGQSTE
jgi:hypothetical protein